ncbi:MAG: hypothetical protein FWH20_10185 [Oscillospiraceae bacterium]|nr:hypothetical protein [Oscillospiraceae bacterium]
MNSLCKLVLLALGVAAVAISIIAIIKHISREEDDCYLCGDDEDFLF